MADNYDKESPALENSTINEMFPDLLVVKKEIFNYYDTEFESTPISIQYKNSCEDKKPLREEIKPQTFTQKHKQTCAALSDTENKLVKRNKIILGSKPNRDSEDENDFEISFKPYQTNDMYLSRDSKVNRVSVNENYFEESVTPYEPNVVLQDIQSYLQKSKRFCETCNILFPETGSFETHVQIFHTKRDTPGTSHKKIIAKCSQHRCTICAKYFVAAHVLRRHMVNIHKVNNTERIENNTKKTDTSYMGHEKSFESTNTCFHCKKTFETQKSLIDHLYDILQMKRKKTEIVPVLKSILFKCNKCDIHFTSSQVAADHAEHMEMLINWKCSICNRIFKKEDELSHERQHSVSNNFLVYNLEEVEVTKILFKCSKCTAHFTESNFLYHFRDCGLQETKSVHCKICDILLDYNLKTTHEADKHSGLNYFTVIKTDVISDNPVKSIEKRGPAKAPDSQMRNKLSELLKSFREVKIVLEKIDSSKLNARKRPGKVISPDILSSVSSKETTDKLPEMLKDKVSRKSRQRSLITIKKPKDKGRKCISNGNRKIKLFDKNRLERMDDQFVPKRHPLAYSYCKACKCFITHFRTNVHKQSRCKKLVKLACKLCGLILTKSSFATHRRLHEKRRDLKFNDFRFYDLYSGQSINPPIPEYPKCVDCAVHFLSKIDRNNHICNEEAYLTCHLCEMNLSEAAFKLHITFHQYTLDDINQSMPKHTQSAMISNLTQKSSTSTDNEIELNNPFDVVDTTTHHSSEIDEIVYTCGTCSVSVDTYDKVVEHCQGHYKDEKKEIVIENCNYCNLKIEKACYADHHSQHEKGKTFNLLQFDSYYLPAENHMWVKHIFEGLPNSTVVNILGKSIYRFECRIKMEVVQQGDPNLTVYKCDQCSCFIDPGSLFKHSENSCFKLRQHPCSLCGIPFISSASRVEHEKVHSHPGVTMNSYRIVVFNREQDKQINRSFCLRKNYVLYKCRNCGVVINKLLRHFHECDVTKAKKCPECALLLHSKEYEIHVNTHKKLASFNYSNMKVIILGESNQEAQLENTSKSKFKGAIYDYKMFICYKCEVCVKNEKCIPKHICRFGKQRSKCYNCGLYFSVGRLKTHIRAHERDPDFLRSNMNIITFDPCTLDQNKNATLISTENSEHSDSNTDSDSDIVMVPNDIREGDNAESITMATETVIEETAKVYKCPCALYFLNEDSIFRHFGVCRTKAKISKQKCPKCDLLFTPNVLFTHLLAHHSNKSRRYKYEIIEMDNPKKAVLQ